MTTKVGVMPNYRVEVLEKSDRGRRDALRCHIGTHLRFTVKGLQSYFFADWSPTVVDALLVAAAVEFCDLTLRRRSLVRGREIELGLPVHDVDLWKSRAVSDALVDALNLLTGDRWSLRIRARKNSEERPLQGQFMLPTATQAVMPFSDGLDSWAVGTCYDHDHPGHLLRVRLGPLRPPKPKARSRPPAFLHVPYKVRTSAHRTESSVRSRGFKFALISGIAAYLAKVEDIVVPESGQGILGPVIMPAGAGEPDFRCHPRFTALMERFLFALLGHGVRYRFPRLGYTKGETLRAAVAADPSATSWAATRTCWQSSRHVSVHDSRRQCGICAACLLRRLSVHSAGLTEPSTTYLWEDLRSSDFRAGANAAFTRFTPALKQHAIAGTLHLARLATLASSSEYLDLANGTLLLSQALRLPEVEVAMQQNVLWRQHRQEWQSFVSSLGSESFVTRWAQAAA